MEHGNNIDPTYLIPIEHISCPGCGLKYGHHNTKVDIHSEECSSCVKKMGYDNVELVDAHKFIERILGIG